MRVTLDHNGLINLANGTGEVQALRQLSGLHGSGVITLCIPAIAASENQKDTTPLKTYGEFAAFVASLGLKEYVELHPMAYFDVTFFDHCVFTDEAMLDLEREIHAILFPTVEFSYGDYAARRGLSPEPPLDRRWRNAKCDVQAMWCHIHHGADVFVSEDSNFHKVTKKPRLLTLGAGAICTPFECVSLVTKKG